MIGALADLHIHTALSPCASREMVPCAIVLTARQRRLDVIAICDHNTAANVSAVSRAAARETEGSLAVIPGIEITTREEVHVVGLFPALEPALDVSRRVLETLPWWDAGGRDFAECEQWILDDRDRRVGTERRMLAAASRYSLSEAVGLIRENDGVAVAAHVHRRAFSVLGQLGFFPQEPRFDAAEVSAEGVARGRAEELECHGIPLIASSDSHYLEDIGGACIALAVEGLGFPELVLAIRGAEGRGCVIA